MTNLEILYTTQENKYDYEKKLCYFKYNGVTYLPLNSLTFFTLDCGKDNKSYSKRNDKIRETVEEYIEAEGNEYIQSLFLNDDYIVITKEDNFEEWDKITEALGECYFENTGKKFRKGNSAKKIYLFTESGCRLLLSNFKFSREYADLEYSEKYGLLVRDRAIYFTRTEQLIKTVFDKEIICHNWFYLGGNQLKKFCGFREEVIDKLTRFHNYYYDTNEGYRYKFGMTKAEPSLRDSELRKILEFHIDGTFCNSERLSYRCVNYTNYLGLRGLLKEIDKNIANRWDLTQYLLDLVNIYKPVKSAVNHGEHKTLEQYLVNKRENIENVQCYSTYIKSFSFEKKGFHSNTLRYKVMNMRNHFANHLEDNVSCLTDFDKEYYYQVYDSSLITKYFNKLKDYQNTLRDFYSLKYDIENNVDKFKNPIGMAYDRFIKNEISYAMNYITREYSYCPYHKEEYYDKRYEITIECENELLELKAKTITLKNELYQLGSYLSEYLKDDITNQILIEQKNQNNTEELLNEVLNYNPVSDVTIKSRHINRLLEDDYE